MGVAVIVILVLVGTGTGIYLAVSKTNDIASPAPKTPGVTQKKKLPSERLKAYSDPSGFTLQYPEDLSLEAKEADDESVYADVQFSSKDVPGSLRLKIADSKIKTAQEWFSKGERSLAYELSEVSLGNLKAFESQTANGVGLAALDSGVLFTIEVDAQKEEEFWAKVYEAIRSHFTFVSAAKETVSSSGGGSNASTTSDEVIFEGEEVVE